MKITVKDTMDMVNAPKSPLEPIDIYCTDSQQNVVRVPDAYWSETRNDWFDEVTESSFSELSYDPLFWVKPASFSDLMLFIFHVAGLKVEK